MNIFKNKKTSIFLLTVMSSWIIYSLAKFNSHYETSLKLMGIVMGIVLTVTIFFVAILGKHLYNENHIKKKNGNSNFGN